MRLIIKSICCQFAVGEMVCEQPEKFPERLLVVFRLFNCVHFSIRNIFFRCPVFAFVAQYAPLLLPGIWPLRAGCLILVHFDWFYWWSDEFEFFLTQGCFCSELLNIDDWFKFKLADDREYLVDRK